MHNIVIRVLQNRACIRSSHINCHHSTVISARSSKFLQHSTRFGISESFTFQGITAIKIQNSDCGKSKITECLLNIKSDFFPCFNVDQINWNIILSRSQGRIILSLGGCNIACFCTSRRCWCSSWCWCLLCSGEKIVFSADFSDVISWNTRHLEGPSTFQTTATTVVITHSWWHS